MHAYLSDLVSTAHRADLLAEGAVWREPSLRGTWVRAPRRVRASEQRLAVWARRPRAGRPVVACCPA
jgi:hypothetical protein